MKKTILLSLLLVSIFVQSLIAQEPATSAPEYNGKVKYTVSIQMKGEEKQTGSALEYHGAIKAASDVLHS